MTGSGTGSHDQMWYWKTWPEVVAEAISHTNNDQKWHRKSYPEGLPEVISRSGTGIHTRNRYRKSLPEVIPRSGTESHSRKWYQKSYPEGVPEIIPWKTWTKVIWEAITYGQIRYDNEYDEFIANYQQTDRQTECYTTGNIHCNIPLLTSLQTSHQHSETVSTQAEPRTKTQKSREEFNKGESTLLIRSQHGSFWFAPFFFIFKFIFIFTFTIFFLWKPFAVRLVRR